MARKQKRIFMKQHFIAQIMSSVLPSLLMLNTYNIFVILLGMESGLCGEVDYSLLVIEIDMLPAPNYQ